MEAMELYSNFADDWEIIVCFIDFYEIKESPRNTQKPVIDLLVSAHPAQSELVKALR